MEGLYINIRLQNEYLLVMINDKGAELQSIQDTQGLEYIWQGDPAIWPRRAPVLFPIVGKLKNNQYTLNGKKYEMPQHGFARDMIFDVVHESHYDARFQLKSTDETLAIYPYAFEFEIAYELRGACIHVTYEIRNKTNEDMFFSVGAHEGYRCPLHDGEKFEDYELLFNRDTNLLRHFINNDGLQISETQNIPLNKQSLGLEYSLFEKDAMLLKGISSDEVSLIHTQTKRGIAVKFKGFPYLGIWTKQDAPFVCIEPWFGIADVESTDGDFAIKEGINRLKPFGIFSCTHTIQVICFQSNK